MSKLLIGKIDVLKIDKARLFEGKKGTYLDIAVWINDEEDEYGQIASIQQQTDKSENPIYIGNLKEYVKKDTAEAKIGSDPTELSEPDDSMPF